MLTSRETEGPPLPGQNQNTENGRLASGEEDPGPFELVEARLSVAVVSGLVTLRVQRLNSSLRYFAPTRSFFGGYYESVLHIFIICKSN